MKKFNIDKTTIEALFVIFIAFLIASSIVISVESYYDSKHVKEALVSFETENKVDLFEYINTTEEGFSYYKEIITGVLWIEDKSGNLTIMLDGKGLPINYYDYMLLYYNKI